MLRDTYLVELGRALISDHPWERSQFFRFFPQQPKSIYSLMEKAGFSSSKYRESWPDLIAGLPSEKWSAKHFIQFMDTEVRVPRCFPIHLDFFWLDKLAQNQLYNKIHMASLLRSMVQAQIDFSPNCIKEIDFWENTFKLLSKFGAPIIFFGDSHSRVFRQTIKNGKLIILPINVLCGGGSAIGLPNRKSRSGYGARLEDGISAINEAKKRNKIRVPLCFAFGQVDVEFVHTYRRLKRKEFQPAEATFDEFCAQVASSYVAWISKLAPHDSVAVGINPPCINDQHIFEAYLAQMQVYLHARISDVPEDDSFESLIPDFENLKFPVKPIRTNNAKLFNQHIQKQSELFGINYIDSFQNLIGPDGCILPKFSCASDGREIQVGGDGKDIHIGGKYTLEIQAQLVKGVFDKLSHPSADMRVQPCADLNANFT